MRHSGWIAPVIHDAFDDVPAGAVGFLPVYSTPDEARLAYPDSEPMPFAYKANEEDETCD